MWTLVTAWRSELLTVLAFAFSWWFFSRMLHLSFLKTWVPGFLLGAAVEIMTEPEWTYTMQCYIWRDVSPFVMMGWGIMFSWMILFSDKLYRTFFHVTMSERAPQDPRLWLTDVLVGLPFFLGNELFGLHILKSWKYNAVLQWTTMLPGINYPLEGLVAILFFSLGLPAAVRFWKGYPVP